MVVAPDGTVLPCHAASIIPGLRFDNVREKSIREIWENSSAFLRFRGDDWMQEPCKSCERRLQDFAGCRCQAFLLAGDSSSTDPVCSLAPARPKIDALLRSIGPSTAPLNENEKPTYLYRGK